MAILAKIQRTPQSPLGGEAEAQPSSVKQEDGDLDISDKGYEACWVGKSTLSFPQELLDLPDLRGILSLDTWNRCLSEEEREQLMPLLPADLDRETFVAVLEKLFSGENIDFGSPMESFLKMLKEGAYHAEVVSRKAALCSLQKNQYYHLLRNYHNGMVNSFLEMQKLWEEYPNLEIEGRLEIWRKWKETKVKPPIPEKMLPVQKSKTTAKPNAKDGKPAAQKEAGSNGKTAKKVVKQEDDVKPIKFVPVPVQGIGKSTKPKGLLKTTKKTNEIGRGSPPSDTETSTGDDNVALGTSSSLTGSDKKRKASSVDLGKQKKAKADDSATSSEDVMKPDSDSSGKLQADLQCIANSEATSTQGRRVKKDSSESPPSAKSARKSALANMSDFPFSAVQFLSAVRRALLVPYAPPKEPAGEAVCVNNNSAASSPAQELEENGSDNDGPKAGLFPVPFHEVVKRVQANPGDPRVLETHETLPDLVWGALKIFSSKVAPGKAKGWKPLATYEKDIKSWYWLGVQGVADGEKLADEWGIPLKTLAKVEEAFATWYKHGEVTRQQMVQLPVPPPMMSTPVDEKERFRDMRAQKSLITISPSSQDMRAYFRKEEVLRYSVPDRAFAYTRSDGHKSVVAPLRRAGGKPNSKARDHFMLKPNRPPHVNILCLVRDAAARLPGGIGTRADVCALIRDSQYIMEDVTESQVNQVVSGALDRLHYERDPCVRFDSERKLWMYLHTDRTEDDFEDDGTSSTKRWKKQKKDDELLAARHCDSYSPELDTNPSSAIYSGGGTELVYPKGSSLASPRVLNSCSSHAEDPASAAFQQRPAQEQRRVRDEQAPQAQEQEQREQSKEQRQQSKEQRQQSKEQWEQSKEQREQSKEQREQSKEQQEQLQEQREQLEEPPEQLEEPPEQLKQQLQEQSVIDRIGGADVGGAG